MAMTFQTNTQIYCNVYSNSRRSYLLIRIKSKNLKLNEKKYQATFFFSFNLFCCFTLGVSLTLSAYAYELRVAVCYFFLRSLISVSLISS